MLEELGNQTDIVLNEATHGALSTFSEDEQDLFDQSIETFITQHALPHIDVVTVLNSFYERTGKFFPEDAYYEQRMNFFWDHFIFNTPWLTGKHQEPLFTSKAADGIRETFDDAHYSLFRIRKTKLNQIIVRDQLSGDKIYIHARPRQVFTGLKKGDYLQSWLYEKDGKSYLSRGLIIHPEGARKSIIKYIKTLDLDLKNAKLDFLSTLAAKQIRHIRHQHVAPERIYRELLSQQR